MAWYDTIANTMGVAEGDPGNAYRNALQANAQQQQQFGQSLQGQYMANQGGMAQTQGMLQGLASGNNSVSSMQLQQGLQQNLAAQQAQAASAAPQNAAMAARTAAIQSGQIGAGMAGQQALAGVQERQGALNTLAQMQTQQAGQNVQGALGAYGAANNAYGTDLQNPQKTWGPLVGGALAGAAGAGAKFA